MVTADLFPAELAAAQAELAEAHPYEPKAPAEPIEDPPVFLDDRERYSEPYWLTWEEQYARDVGVRRSGPI